MSDEDYALVSTDKEKVDSSDNQKKFKDFLTDPKENEDGEFEYDMSIIKALKKDGFSFARSQEPGDFWKKLSKAGKEFKVGGKTLNVVKTTHDRF